MAILFVALGVIVWLAGAVGFARLGLLEDSNDPTVLAGLMAALWPVWLGMAVVAAPILGLGWVIGKAGGR